MTQRISFTRPGDRLSARFVNRLVDASNLALGALGPARSTRLPEATSLNPELDAEGNGTLDGLTTRTYTEASRTTSEVDVDGVQISRIETVTLNSDDEIITLIFDNA